LHQRSVWLAYARDYKYLRMMACFLVCLSTVTEFYNTFWACLELWSDSDFQFERMSYPKIAITIIEKVAIYLMGFVGSDLIYQYFKKNIQPFRYSNHPWDHYHEVYDIHTTCFRNISDRFLLANCEQETHHRRFHWFLNHTYVFFADLSGCHKPP